MNERMNGQRLFTPPPIHGGTPKTSASKAPKSSSVSLAHCPKIGEYLPLP